MRELASSRVGRVRARAEDTVRKSRGGFGPDGGHCCRTLQPDSCGPSARYKFRLDSGAHGRGRCAGHGGWVDGDRAAFFLSLRRRRVFLVLRS